MKYRLKNCENIRIDKSAKEDFKKMMGWDETTFKIHTEEIIEDKKTLSDEFKEATGIGDGGYPEKDVKKAIKEFIESMKNYHSTMGMDNVNKKAKEIFGKRLVKG